MAPTAAMFLVIFMVVGGYVGWHVRQAQGANADLKVHKERIPRFRRVRNRSGLTAILVVVVTVLVMQAVVRAIG